MRAIGGPIGQRERVHLTMWGAAMLSGVLTHYHLGMPDEALMLLLGAGAALLGSYTYRASAAGGPAAAGPVRAAPGDSLPPT